MSEQDSNTSSMPAQPPATTPEKTKKKRINSLFLAILIIAAILIVAGLVAGLSWAVFVNRSDNVVVRKTAQIIPIPAAKLGSKIILYRDFMQQRDTMKIFLDSEAAKEQQLQVPFDNELEENLLEKLISQAALEELAEQKEVTISESELREFFTDVVMAASSTTPDIGVYLLENFGWSEEDFRQHVLRPALLEQQLSVKMAEEQQGDPNALAVYLTERLERDDVVRYLRF